MKQCHCDNDVLKNALEGRDDIIDMRQDGKGAAEKEAALDWVGGLDIRLIEKVLHQLQLSGLDARLSIKPGMRCVDQSNRRNRGMSDKAVSRGKRLLDHETLVEFLENADDSTVG